MYNLLGIRLKKESKVYLILMLILCLWSPVKVRGEEVGVIINEIMPLNDSVLQDEDGEYVDWIELYNAGPSVESLLDWSLTDDAESPGKWVFPDVTLEAGAYMLVFASGKDRRIPGEELHTNFSLKGSGEYLALLNRSGDTASLFNPGFPPVSRNCSYGYLDGAYTMFSFSTPGTMNLETAAVMESPLFSRKHNLFSVPFELKLSSAVEGADIYYSTDGSLPDSSTGKHYASALLIDSTTILRARAYKGFRMPSEVVTNTYVFPGKVARQPNTPAGFPGEWGPWSLSDGRAYADYEMDPELVGDPLYAARVEDGLLSIPTLSLVTDLDHLFSMSTDPERGGIYMYPAVEENDIGRGWERPVSAEYFNRQGSESFHLNCGIQIHGGESRRPEKSPKHSFRLRFRGVYGPSKLNYPLFGEEYLQEFDALVLRAGFGNSWTHWKHSERNRAQYIRDAWLKESHRAMGHIGSRSLFAHLYINGVYWGIYAPSERIDEEFAAAHMGGDPGDYDLIKDYNEVMAGDRMVWDRLMAKAKAGLASREAYMAIQGKSPDGTPDPASEPLVDVINLADYMLVNFYAGNTDWDHHNWAAARSRVNPDKGFKFFAWDSEHVLESLSHNMVNENNQNCPSYVFQQLRQNEEFRRLFADRVQRFCFNGGLLTPEGGLATWMNRVLEIEPALVAETARWGDYRRDVHPYIAAGPFELYGYDTHWLEQKQFLLNSYFPERTDVLIRQLRDAGLFPELDAPVFYINDRVFTGRYINRFDELAMSATEGEVYYTTNGSDPALWPHLDSSGAFPLVTRDAAKKVMVPRVAQDSNWMSDITFNASLWTDCLGAPGGVGYEKSTGYESLISLDVGSQMHEDGGSPNNTCYIRIPFEIDTLDTGEWGSLILSIHYDDGFVAWLNGQKVASANAPENPAWSSSATGQNEALAGSPVRFDISEYISILEQGDNLLAIQGLNIHSASSDFIITAALTAYDQKQSACSPDALIYTAPILVDSSMHIVARTNSNGAWSARHDRFLVIPEDYRDLKITELHYHPVEMDSIDSEQLEFLEIKNTGGATIDLGGVSLKEGVRYTFMAETQVLPGEFIVLASDKSCFAFRYGFEAFDEYKGKLDNGGERIVLMAPTGDTLIFFAFEDAPPWPLYTDGEGHSLVPLDINPTGNLQTPEQWRASFYPGGSPGADDVDTTLSVEHAQRAKQEFMLAQNFPNPVTDVTHFSYQIPNDARVELSLYSLTGSKIITLESGQRRAGMHTVTWHVSSGGSVQLPGGIYLYRLSVQSRTSSWQSTRKLIVTGF
ncbi:MAG: lamin tail domain-containing protein [Bacteroidota bacterium]